MLHKNEIAIIICSGIFLMVGLTILLMMTNNLSYIEMDARETRIEEESLPLVLNSHVETDEIEKIIKESLVGVLESDQEDTGIEAVPLADALSHGQVHISDNAQGIVDEDDLEVLDLEEEVVEAETEEEVEEIEKEEEVEKEEVEEVEVEEEVTEELQLVVPEKVTVLTDDEIDEILDSLTKVDTEALQAQGERQQAELLTSDGFMTLNGVLTTSSKDTYLIYLVSGEYAVITFSQSLYTGIGEIYVDNRFVKSVDTNTNVDEPGQVKSVRVELREKGRVELKIVSDTGFGQELQVLSVVSH